MTFVLPDPGPVNLEFDRPADRARLEQTAKALASRGFIAQVADSTEHARQLVLDAIHEGAEVHSALSETMRALGITAEIDESGRYDSIRSRLKALDRDTEGRQMRKLAAAPDYIVGSADAVTDDGEIVVGSGSGSQLGAYAYAGGNVILVIGHQKLVHDLDEGLRPATRVQPPTRVRPHASRRLPRNNARKDADHPPRTLRPHHRHPRPRDTRLLAPGRLTTPHPERNLAAPTPQQLEPLGDRFRPLR